MRGAILIVFVFFSLISCSSHKEEKLETMTEETKSQALDLSAYSQRNITLINQIGSISMYLPITIDTFFSYVDFGEYHCGETKQFRFASKKFKPVGITDCTYSDSGDSLYQMTIIQTYNKDCETNIIVDEAMFNSIKRDKTHEYSMLDVRGKKIIVGIMKRTKQGSDLVEINAVTTISGRMVKFLFQCYKKSSENFVDNMLTSLRSLVIKENPNLG